MSSPNLFQNDRTVEQISVKDMADWFRSSSSPSLSLPPIQRSLVWTNEQILNYWDSLMRGYPAGMMMVHRAQPNKEGEYLGRGAEDKTTSLSEGDFQLFDGQQRLSAILLGFNVGPLSGSRRIWVDLKRNTKAGDRLFELRINSEGQPFGYKPDKPNEKSSIESRRNALKNWRALSDQTSFRTKAFEAIFAQNGPVDPHLIDAERPLLLAELVGLLTSDSSGPVVEELIRQHDCSALITSLRNALQSQIILSLVDSELTFNPDEYGRLFSRIGQGGTRLSNDELTYSLVKQAYPHVYDRMRKIMAGPGRFASEIDLVLGALRIAKLLAWDAPMNWKKTQRPNPQQIWKMRQDDTNMSPVESLFISLISDAEDGGLEQCLRILRSALLYNAKDNPLGLPAMLLARLPRDLLDVLNLFTIKHGVRDWDNSNREALISFSLYWLLFVENDEKASNQCLLMAASLDWDFSPQTAAQMISLLEMEVARPAPRVEHWPMLHGEISQRNSKLATWNDRFTGVEQSIANDPGQSLRVLSTNSELIRRALMWLQRDYIDRAFPDYNPLSTRDDDLPADLDHAIPQSVLRDQKYPSEHWPAITSAGYGQFRDARNNHIGNSLGNFRWLTLEENRSRGKGLIEPTDPKNPVGDEIDREVWNRLIVSGEKSNSWAGDDFDMFQRLIDTRSLMLIEKLINESGIASALVLISRRFKRRPRVRWIHSRIWMT